MVNLSTTFDPYLRLRLLLSLKEIRYVVKQAISFCIDRIIPCFSGISGILAKQSVPIGKALSALWPRAIWRESIFFALAAICARPKCGKSSVKPGFHIIVRIVPVVSKNVQTIGTIIWKRYPDDRKRPGRFKIYTIVPIVRIELNSIQAIEVVSVVRVVCDRLGSVSI